MLNILLNIRALPAAARRPRRAHSRGWRGGECYAGMFSLGENRPGLMVFAATASFQGADARPCSRLLETARRGRLARLYSPAAIDMASRA